MSVFSRFSWRGLTPQIFFFFILPLTVLLLLVTFGGVYLHHHAMRSLVGERDERAARAAASALGEQINHRAAAIRSLALLAGEAASAEALGEALAAASFLRADFDQGLAFYSPDGRLLAGDGQPGFWPAANLESDPLLKPLLVLDQTPTFVSASHPLHGDPVMFVSAPAGPGGPLAVGAFSPAVLIHRALANVFNPGEGAVAFVIDAGHRVLYQVGDFIEAESPASHPGVAEGLRGESGATYVQVNGREHVVAYSPVSWVGWALVIEESWEAVTSPRLRASENAPLVLIPALVLALAALWFGARRIVQPLQDLEARAAELGWGNYEAIEEPVGGIAEIRRLQAELVHLAHKVKSAQQGLRGYIGAITLGQEEERRRLARELHDDTLQALIALNQRVQLAHLAQSGELAGRPPAEGQARSPAPAPAKEDAWAEIQALTEQTIQNLRRLTRALRPIYLEDLGLAAALEMLCRETGQASGLQVSFQSTGQERRLPATAELALYRIAQEALSNAARHAGASRAALEIGFTPQAVVLEVSDDGHGFSVPESPAEFVPAGHYGLLGMHERAELIAARLEIHSAPGQGTRVTVYYANSDNE